jgi:hypothetical protein
LTWFLPKILYRLKSILHNNPEKNCSMKIFYILFAIAFLGILNISCSLCKKEIRSEQTETEKMSVLPAAREKTAAADTLTSAILLHSGSTTEDTVTGILNATGNEPFTRLAIYVSSNTMYYIEADSSLKSQLWKLQGQRIGVIGIKKSDPLGTLIDVSSFYLAP